MTLPNCAPWRPEEPQVRHRSAAKYCLFACLAALANYRVLIRNKSSNVLWTHCIKEPFALKHLNTALNHILECVVNVVNFIKSRLLEARFFLKTYMRIWRRKLGLAIVYGWLSWGNILSITFERKNFYFA